MSTSPYTPIQIKQYLRTHNIQQTINQTINSLLKQKPLDPYSYLIGQFQKKCVPDIQIKDLELREVISAEGFVFAKVRVLVSVFNQEKRFYIEQPIGYNQEGNVFDADGINGKGIKSMIAFYNDKIKPVLKSHLFKCSQQQQIDSQLQKALISNEKKGLYIINLVSMSIPFIKSQIFSTPLYQTISQLNQTVVVGEQNPKLIVSCLQGGKLIGSKCKVFKYYLMTQTKQGISLVQNVLINVRKAITSGKGGQAALKYSSEGTFICPLDTIIDNFKIIEDAIIAAGAKDYCRVGLSWAADTLFTPETKKYQLENPKTPFDNDQMIDYLTKLCTDKPIIGYLEDPLASSQVGSWIKLKKKLRQTQSLKHIKLGCRSGSLLNLTGQSLKQKHSTLSIHLTPDSNPQLTPQQLTIKNSQKLQLDLIQIRLSQIKTISNLIKINKILVKTSTGIILQDNSNQSYCVDLVDVAFGMGMWVNIATLGKYQRNCKLNRAIEILYERIN